MIHLKAVPPENEKIKKNITDKIIINTCKLKFMENLFGLIKNLINFVLIRVCYQWKHEEFFALAEAQC